MKELAPVDASIARYSDFESDRSAVGGILLSPGAASILMGEFRSLKDKKTYRYVFNGLSGLYKLGRE